MNCWITITDGNDWHTLMFAPGDPMLHYLVRDGWHVVRIDLGYWPSPWSAI